MGTPIYQVDAFTGKAFAGNPAAVCLLSDPRSEDWVQSVAHEMNLSETAFLQQRKDGFDLRWFTPTVEVDLCGHATLASAHVLWEAGRLGKNDQARFHTHSGLLTAIRKGEWIELDFPAEPAEPVVSPPELIQALGVSPSYTGKNRLDYLVELRSEEEVKKLAPNIPLLRQMTMRGIIVTSQAKSGDFDFVSRYFAPGAGIDEDPVTGSAHCCLAPFWSARLGKVEMVGYQASQRGGVVGVQVLGDRVLLRGQAVTVLRGELV